VCGCFYDSIDSFEKKVKEVHSGNLYETQYLLSIEIARKSLKIGDQKSVR
jgi:hypothetical protein